jgi:pimeloyl-ACP methyl ester carboxylesterase
MRTSSDASSREVGGVRLRFLVWGPAGGTPVVLLHGGSSSAATWEGFAASLAAAGYRVMAPDLRGHGGSARAASYPLTAFHDDVLGLLNALGLHRIALVGHSLGAYVASCVAQSDPTRVQRLVLEELSPPPRDARPVRHMHRIDQAKLALAALLRVRRFDPAAITSVVAQLGVPDPRWWEQLSSITAETLVISGGLTSHVSPQRLSDVARAMPRARLVTIPAGHRVHSHGAVRFGETVLPFLSAPGDAGA